MRTQQYDLLIIGAGVSGTALLYLASRYTDLKHVGIIDKYAAPARVNSLSSNNSQTLHCLSLIHISEPTRPELVSSIPYSA